MKTFKQFMIIAEVAEIPMTPEQIAASRARRAAAAERLAQNAGTSGEKAAAEAAAERIRAVSGKPPTGTTPKSSAIVKSGPSALSTNVKPPVQKIKTNLNVPGGKKIPGLKSSVFTGAIDTALEKQKGSGWARSLAKGATTALGTVAGGIAGGAVGSAAGPVGTAVGGYAGQAAGAAAASKAFDVAAGANARERAAMRQQKRLSQSGGRIVGTGGPTSISQKGKTGFISTGTGANRRTAQLGSTSVVKGPKGELQTGHLAFKTDPTTGKKQAVYKRADTSNTTLAKTSSNPFERIGRTLNPNAYKAHDAQMRSSQLKKAAASDAARQRQLGTNTVGPKIVGPKKPN